MRKPLTTIPQTSTHLGRQLEGKQQVIQKRAVCKAILCHQYSKTRCQQGTKFGRIPLGSVFIKQRENAGQMFAGHPCNRYQATTDNHIYGQWL